MAYGAPPPQDPYGYGQPGGYGGQIEHPKGTMVLILGILGIVTCQILGVVAFFIGKQAKADVDANPGRYSNAGSIQAGYIMGIVSIVLLVLAIIFVIIYFVFFGVLIASTSTGSSSF